MRAMRLAVLLVLTVAPVAHSQSDLDPPRIFGGGALVYGSPQGDFGRHVDHAFGGIGHVMFRFDDSGSFALRLDGGALIYGQEKFRVPLSTTVGGRITVDVTTSNNIFFLGVGPQIGVPDGRFRPYANGFLGITFLNTTSSVSGTRDGEDDPFASTSNLDDATFAYGGGGGVFIPLRGGNRPISLDIGASYHRSGDARYLREGDIEDRPDGTIVIHPVRSRTDLLQIYIGASVGLGEEPEER